MATTMVLVIITIMVLLRKFQSNYTIYKVPLMSVKIVYSSNQVTSMK